MEHRNANAAPPREWYGEYELAEGTSAYWRIGPMRFWIARTKKEWRFGSVPGNDPLDPSLERDLDGGVPEPVEAAETAVRLGADHPGRRLILTPMTADRPVVVRPVTPFLLPPGEELTLCVSTMVWLQVQVGDEPHEFLQLPLFRPSDTWFGASTGDGELCYSLQTSARLYLEKLPIRPHRAISALRVRNRAATNLSIERVVLPLPHMSIFAGEDGKLWTETVTLEHTQDGRESPLLLGRKAPAHAGVTRKLSGPRQKSGRGLLTRAFGTLKFGGF